MEETALTVYLAWLSGYHHHQAKLVRPLDDFLVPYRTKWINNARYTASGSQLYYVRERHIGI